MDFQYQYPDDSELRNMRPNLPMYGEPDELFTHRINKLINHCYFIFILFIFLL